MGVSTIDIGGISSRYELGLLFLIPQLQVLQLRWVHHQLTKNQLNRGDFGHNSESDICLDVLKGYFAAFALRRDAEVKLAHLVLTKCFRVSTRDITILNNLVTDIVRNE